MLPAHGGPRIFTPAIRRRQADIRTALSALIERERAAGELRADLTAVDPIVAASLISGPLPVPGDWNTHGRRQIDLLIDGLASRGPAG